MQRWLLGVVLAALVGVTALGLATFVWPSDAARGEYSLGPASDFAAGTVTSYLIAEDAWTALPPARDYSQPLPTGWVVQPHAIVHVVRLPDGEFRAFSATDGRGSTVAWYGDLEWFDGRHRGVFAEGRFGSQFTIDGERISGPAPRGLDSYTVQVNASGVLSVDLRQLTEGSSE